MKKHLFLLVLILLVVQAFGANVGQRIANGVYGSNDDNYVGHIVDLNQRFTWTDYEVPNIWWIRHNIVTGTNGVLFAMTNLVDQTITNGFYLATNPSNYVDKTVTNGLYLSSNPSNYVDKNVTNSLVGIFYPLLANPSNYVDKSVTNGLYLSSNPLNFVDKSVTNGLLGTYYPLLANPSNYVDKSVTNGLYLSSNPLNFVDKSVTNGLLGTYYPLLANPSNYVDKSVTNGLYLSSNPLNFVDKSVTNGLAIPSLTNALGGIFYPLVLNPSNYVDKTVTNGLVGTINTNQLVDKTITNGLYSSTNPSNYVDKTVTNGLYLASNPAGYVDKTITNSLAGVSTNGLYPSSNPSNYVDKSVTNGLAIPSLTNGLYLASNPSSYVDKTVTNGLTGIYYPLLLNPSNYVDKTVTNSLTSTYYPLVANPSNFVTKTVTNGLYPSNNPSNYVDASVTNGVSVDSAVKTNDSRVISLAGPVSVTSTANITSVIANYLEVANILVTGGGWTIDFQGTDINNVGSLAVETILPSLGGGLSFSQGNIVDVGSVYTKTIVENGGSITDNDINLLTRSTSLTNTWVNWSAQYLDGKGIGSFIQTNQTNSFAPVSGWAHSLNVGVSIVSSGLTASGASSVTSSLSSAFYPRFSNPSVYVDKTVTNGLYPSANPSNFVDKAITNTLLFAQTSTTSQTASNSERIINVLTFGADNTGIANSTLAFSNAFTYAATNTLGGLSVVYFPEGDYKTTGVDVNATNLVIRGVNWGATRWHIHYADIPAGGYFLGLKGSNVVVEGIGFYGEGRTNSPVIWNGIQPGDEAGGLDSGLPFSTNRNITVQYCGFINLNGGGIHSAYHGVVDGFRVDHCYADLVSSVNASTGFDGHFIALIGQNIWVENNVDKNDAACFFEASDIRRESTNSSIVVRNNLIVNSHFGIFRTLPIASPQSAWWADVDISDNTLLTTPDTVDLLGGNYGIVFNRVINGVVSRNKIDVPTGVYDSCIFINQSGSILVNDNIVNNYNGGSGIKIGSNITCQVNNNVASAAGAALRLSGTTNLTVNGGLYVGIAGWNAIGIEGPNDYISMNNVQFAGTIDGAGSYGGTLGTNVSFVGCKQLSGTFISYGSFPKGFVSRPGTFTGNEVLDFPAGIRGDLSQATNPPVATLSPGSGILVNGSSGTNTTLKAGTTVTIAATPVSGAILAPALGITVNGSGTTNTTLTPGSTVTISNSIATNSLAALTSPTATIVPGANITLNGGSGNVSLTAGGNTTITIASTGGGGIASMTTSAVWGASALPSSFTWGTIGSVLNSNAAAPVYWYSTNNVGNLMGLGFTSAQTDGLQSRFAGAYLGGFDDGEDFGSATGLAVTISTSSTNTLTNSVSILINNPNGILFASNALTSATADSITTFYFLTNNIGAWSVNGVGTNKWTIRLDFKERDNTTSTVFGVDLYRKVIK